MFEEFEEFESLKGISGLSGGLDIFRISSGEVVKIKKAGQLNVRLCNFGWALRDSNPRPSACKADALNQLS